MRKSTKTENCAPAPSDIKADSLLTTTKGVGMGRSQTLHPSGIPVDEILPVREAMRRLGWGQHAFNHAKKQGLRILTFSKYSYIWGTDLLEFLQSQPTVERKGGHGRPDLVERRQSDSPPERTL
jgi:hypothetical protein